MKLIIFFAIVIIGVSEGCHPKRSAGKISGSPPLVPLSGVISSDTVHVFKIEPNFTHFQIKNSSAWQVDMLFNGIDNCFGGQLASGVRFATECMACEPIQEYSGGLLFARQLLFTSEEMRYFKTPRRPAAESVIIDGHANADRATCSFRLNDAAVRMEFKGVSCNDASFITVRFKFPSGNITVDSVLNARVFEYDLDGDGNSEQYLMGTRNCIQEFLLMRFRKPVQI